MKKEERRKKFYDDLLNMLYPPPEQGDNDRPERPESVISSPKSGHISGDIDLSNADDELEDMEKSASGDDECLVQKLSRSQRKRIRKKKLKGAQSQRRKIIGPVLPCANEGQDFFGVQDVRQFVSEEKCDATAECSEVVSYSKRNKQRKRRLAKKEGSDKENSGCLEVEIRNHGQDNDRDEEEKIDASNG